MIQATVQSCFSESYSNNRPRSKRLQRDVCTTLANANVVNSMSAVPLDVDYFPEFSVGTRQEANVIRLPASFWEQYSVMKDHLHERLDRRLRNLVLLRTLGRRRWL